MSARIPRLNAGRLDALEALEPFASNLEREGFVSIGDPFSPIADPLAALVITLLVEIVTRIDGIWRTIANAQRSYPWGQVFGLILVAGLFSFLVNGLISMLQAFAFRNRPLG